MLTFRVLSDLSISFCALLLSFLYSISVIIGVVNALLDLWLPGPVFAKASAFVVTYLVQIEKRYRKQ